MKNKPLYLDDYFALGEGSLKDLSLDEISERMLCVNAECYGGRATVIMDCYPENAVREFQAWCRDNKIKPQAIWFADMFHCVSKTHIAELKLLDDGKCLLIDRKGSKLGYGHPSGILNPWRRRHKSKLLQKIFGQ